MNRSADGLSQWPLGEGDSEPEEEDHLEESIEASIQRIKVEQWQESKRREKAYKLFGGFRLAEEYNGECKEIG